MLLSSFLISLRLLSPQQREEKVKKNHGVLTLQSIQQNGHAMAVSILDSLGNKTCGIILNMFQCFFSFPLVSLHLHSSVNYTNLSVCARVRAKSLSRVRLFATPGTAARQAPLSMGILQARLLWGGCGVAMPSSRRSSRSRDQPTSLMSPALAGEFFTPSAPWAALLHAHSTAGERFPSFPGEASHPVLMAHISINHKTAKPYFCLFVCASSFSHESVEVLACSGSCSLSWAVVWRAPYSFK